MALTRNKLTGIVALIIGVIYHFATRSLPVSAVDDPIGPKAFPLLVSYGLMLVGLLLVLKKEQLTEKNKAVIFNLTTEKDLIKRVVSTCVAGLVFGFILEPVGYLIATFLFMTALMFIANGRRTAYNLLVASIFAVSTYVLFFIMLEVSLPRGILAF